MHKDWCGRSCGECEHPCALDRDSYCSPDCEHLGEDGEMSSPHCKECDAYLAYKEAEENFERMTGFTRLNT